MFTGWDPLFAIPAGMSFNEPVTLLAFGVLGVLAGMLLPAGLGTGYGWLQLAIAGQLSLGLALLILAFKIPGLALTIGSGGSGGVFGPNVVIGGMLGTVVGTVAHALLPGSQVPIAAYVVVGMAAVFAGAARTPISTLIMVPEMTGGYGLIVPTMLAIATRESRELLQAFAAGDEPEDR